MDHITQSTLVINLKSNQQRWQFQQQQIASLGFTAERLDAVSSEQLSTPRYERLANAWQRKLRPAEVACFLSHRQAWKQVLNRNQAMLILEDDALLSQSLPEIIQNIQALDHTIDYITLETRQRKKILEKSKIPLNQPYQLKTLYQDRTGAAAYILFPSGAKKLLSQQKSPGLADAFISSSYQLKSYQTVPAAAIQSDCAEYYGLAFFKSFDSTITPKNNEKPLANSRTAYFCFKVKRIWAQLRMGIRQLRCCTNSQKVAVSIIKSDFEYLKNLK